MNTLCNIINYLSDKFRYYCIIGDFNLTELYGIINANLHCPAAYSELFDCILSHCLIQYVNRPTRGQNYLDLMFGSQFLDIGLTEVDVPFSTSDHCSIVSHILLDDRDNLPNVYPRKNFINADYKAFNDFLMLQNWDEIFSDDDSANEMWDKLCDVINDGLGKFVPNYVNKLNNAKRYPPYIRKMLLKKRLLWRQRFNLNGSLVYKNYAKKCKLVIEKYKARKEMGFLKVKKKNFFTFLNSKLRSKRINLSNMKNKTGTKDTDPSIIADSFLNEFQGYFTHDDGVLPEFDVDHSVADFLEHVEFTPQNVLKHMFCMNRQASAGPDGLPGYFWFSMRDSTCVPLSVIYNKSMSTGKLPNLWKKSIITPVFKRGDPTVYSNYRPVALTSVAYVQNNGICIT
jgi:hypothetical protein